MSNKRKLAIAAILFALTGCTGMAPMPPMDAAPVTGRNWNCPACYK